MAETKTTTPQTRNQTPLYIVCIALLVAVVLAIVGFVGKNTANQQNAELTGGHIELESTLGKGTNIKAVFIKTNIDCLPRGDLAQSVTLLMVGHPTVNFIFIYQYKNNYEISSDEIKEAVGEENFHNPKAIRLISEIIHENLAVSGFETDF